MRKLTISLACLWLLLPGTGGQVTLKPSEGYKAVPVFTEYEAPGPFDLSDTLLYLFSGDTIFRIDLRDGSLTGFYEVPPDYDAYPGFLTLSPDGSEIWAGFTVPGNTDDRIYRVNVASGVWTREALLPGNFDLAFWNDSILVSGLNSTTWSDPASIFLLDTTGADQHRKVIEAGGYSAGLAVDGPGNLYYGTSFSMGPNALYRWDSGAVAGVMAFPAKDTLFPDDAVKLTDLPAGAGDCVVDRSGNLVFNFNDFMASKTIALWNGTPGDGYRFDTLMTADGAGDWLGMVRVQGDITVPSPGNRLLGVSMGRPMMDVHRDYIPVQISPIVPVSGMENGENAIVDLSVHFTDPDDPDDFSFEIAAVSDPAVASAYVDERQLVVDFLAPGQTSMILNAINGGTSLATHVVIGVQPVIAGDYLVSGFGDLELEQGSYWSGSDGSGSFISGAARFYNSYNPEWFAWNGWAYSSVSDVETPGFMNQYSAITGSGFDPEGTGSPNYAVGYPFPVSVIDFPDGQAHEVKGFFVTNTTYAALSMENGDDFSKEFGGSTGADPDFFRLWIRGSKDGHPTDSVVFYLADYRAVSSLHDYIIRTWQWVDVSSLGKVDSLIFSLESSDVGDWGMNTPGFFCLDALHVVPEVTSGLPFPTEGVATDLVVFPNPSGGRFMILTGSDTPVSLRLFTLAGITVYEEENYIPGSQVDIEDLSAGTYILRVTGKGDTVSKMIITQ